MRQILAGLLALFVGHTVALAQGQLFDKRPEPVVITDTSGNVGGGVPGAVSAVSGGISKFVRIPFSPASTNCTLVKASPGRVFKVRGVNNIAGVRYVRFYNAATVPTAGAGTVFVSFGAPNGPFSFDGQGIGYSFSTGIGFCITASAGDTDTTAIGGGDLLEFHVEFE